MRSSDNKRWRPSCVLNLRERFAGRQCARVWCACSASAAGSWPSAMRCSSWAEAEGQGRARAPTVDVLFRECGKASRQVHERWRTRWCRGVAVAPVLVCKPVPQRRPGIAQTLYIRVVGAALCETDLARCWRVLEGRGRLRSLFKMHAKAKEVSEGPSNLPRSLPTAPCLGVLPRSSCASCSRSSAAA